MILQKKAADAALCGLFAALIAVGASIKLPIPYVPITLQTFFVILAGLMLGKRNGTIAVVVYLAIGLLGIPVFTGGGGIGYVLHPTFGYLLGMVAAAYLAGLLAPRGASIVKVLAACGAGMLSVYLVGVPYLYFASRLFTDNPIGVKAVVTAGFLTPLPGDIIKVLLAAVLYYKIIKQYPAKRVA